MKQRFRTGGLSAWSIKHPVGITMLTLSIVILGLFSLQNLGVNLLPHIISPDVLVRIKDQGVPASIMEDQVTRQLEEQLAITEGAIAVQSRTTEGRSAVDLSFPYGTDINEALRDASIRLERAKRYLPENDEAPIIYKRDPSQIPVLEIVVSSFELNSVELRSWVDYTFSKWFLNIPGVAAVEVGGGLEREIQVLPDQEKLALVGLTLQSLATQIQTQNTDAPGGRMHTGNQVVSARTAGRFQTLDELRASPLQTDRSGNIEDTIILGDVAQVIDSNKEERLRIRLNRIPGVKMSIQKQPLANTVAVVEEIRHKLEFLQQQHVIPENIQLAVVGDQSRFVNHAITNAITAALSGAILAMLVIYLFLGSLRRTLIIGSAIPIGILVTFILMQSLDLTLNIMTLGGLALGMGLLIDSTIVMLENITRHQTQGETSDRDAVNAAAEVNSPIIASTSTNLGALLPFLFIGGLSGLLFQELIITITSAMIASLIVALTLVPALGAHIKIKKTKPLIVDHLLDKIRHFYQTISTVSLRHPWASILLFMVFFGLAIHYFFNIKSIYLPNVDEGLVTISIAGDSGMKLDEMDTTVEKIEKLLLDNKDVESIFTTAGGFVFGRTENQNSNRSSIKVQLRPRSVRNQDSQQWLTGMKKEIDKLNLIGFRTYLRVNSVRGVRTNNNDDDISLHIRGNNLEVLRKLGAEAVELLRDVDGLSNLTHSYEEVKEELRVIIDRHRVAEFGVDTAIIGRALRIALEGIIVSDFIDGEKNIDIRLKLPLSESYTVEALDNLFIDIKKGHSVRLGDIASIERHATPNLIVRYQQQRVVEISASYQADADREPLLATALKKLDALELPEGYIIYDNDSNKTLKQSRENSLWILLLAIFLVLVVMAVQYESLLNPLIIILSIPFAIIGVAAGFFIVSDMPISMPVWLGLIMLTGIVVNNAIVLVEQIEIEKAEISQAGKNSLIQAVQQAAALRLRPILMTTLTTVFGMLPLALGLGEGAEMLQPLAFVIVWGLSFSMLVSLILVPVVYSLFHQNRFHQTSP